MPDWSAGSNGSHVTVRRPGAWALAAVRCRASATVCSARPPAHGRTCARRPGGPPDAAGLVLRPRLPPARTVGDRAPVRARRARGRRRHHARAVRRPDARSTLAAEPAPTPSSSPRRVSMSSAWTSRRSPSARRIGRRSQPACPSDSTWSRATSPRRSSPVSRARSTCSSTTARSTTCRRRDARRWPRRSSACPVRAPSWSCMRSTRRGPTCRGSACRGRRGWRRRSSRARRWRCSATRSRSSGCPSRVRGSGRRPS